MALKKVYFLSDLHLGAIYFADPRAKERAVVQWLDSIKNTAAEIYLLGDILDYWYEYRTVVPRGYVRFLGKLAELSDAGVKLHWFIGNHDIWIFDYLPSEIGVEVIDGSVEREIMGKRFFLAHGDGVGRHEWSFALIRGIFRNKFCQWLFAAVHPRWTIPFAHRWSSHSRRSDGMQPSEKAIATVEQFTTKYATEHPEIDYFVYGHLHILRNEPVGANSRMVVLGDWISLNSWAEFDGKELVLKQNV